MKQQTLAMAADQSFENYRKPTWPVRGISALRPI